MQNTIINTAVMFIHVFRSIPMFFKLASEVDRIADKAENKVNIENMKALMPDVPEDQPESRRRALQVFEISLPLSIDRTALRRTLEDKARDMGLRVSMQHRDIFEAVHRVKSI